MGLWAGIKYAINSTLGTPNFKPLNTLISTSESNVKNHVTTQLDSRIQLIGSENFRNLLVNDVDDTISAGQHISKTIKFNVSGTVNIKTHLIYTGYYSNNFFLTVEKNGVKESENRYDIGSGGNGGFLLDFIEQINVQKNDNIVITFYASGSLEYSDFQLGLCYDTVLAPTNGILEVV